jgi:hypothetical protein
MLATSGDGVLPPLLEDMLGILRHHEIRSNCFCQLRSELLKQNMGKGERWWGRGIVLEN